MIIQETILYTTILNPNGTREPKLLNGKYENNMRYYLRILQTDTNKYFNSILLLPHFKLLIIKPLGLIILKLQD